jgi:hypothetical protein
VEKSRDGKWHEVEDADAYGEEYKKYDRTMIGRALVLSKLEEATMLRATTSEESFAVVKHSMWMQQARSIRGWLMSYISGGVI